MVPALASITTEEGFTTMLTATIEVMVTDTTIRGIGTIGENIMLAKERISGVVL